MKRKRFTEEQIIGVLKESEAGAKTDDICRRQGVSSATFYSWRKKYGGMDASEAKRKAVGVLMSEMGLSERRACRITGLSRSVQQYRPLPKDDVAAIKRMKELASESRRYHCPAGDLPCKSAGRGLSAPARHAAA